MYRKITVSGKFDNEKTHYIGLRKKQTIQQKGLGSFDESGYYVVTPLITDDGCTVFVIRGWIPRHLKDKIPPITDRVTITGIVREKENPAAIIQQQQEKQYHENWWMAFDQEMLGKKLGVSHLPILIEQMGNIL